MSAYGAMQPGDPGPLGATPAAEGVNFAVFSAHADQIELCVFERTSGRELARRRLAERTGDIWHGFLPGAGPGTVYGYRAYGPYDPAAGHRFNPNKLLLDPYAREVNSAFAWSDLHCGYIVGDAQQDLSFDPRDNAAAAVKGVVARPLEPRAPQEGARRRWSELVIYELHVRGYTHEHPDVPAPLRGTLAGLGRPAVVERLVKLGIAAVELMPVHPAGHDRRLASHGLRDFWGYSPLNLFAVDRRFLAYDEAEEFRDAVEALHRAGIEVILDVVFSHTGEGDELGPTVSFRGLDNASYYVLGEDRRRYVDVTGCRNTLNLEHPQVRRLVLDSLTWWRSLGVDGFRLDLASALGRETGHFNPASRMFAAIGKAPALSGARFIAEPWDLGPEGYRLGAFPPGWAEWNDRFRDGVRRYWNRDGAGAAEFARRLDGSRDVFEAAGRAPSASVNFVAAHDGFTLQDLVTYETKRNAANLEDGRDGADEKLAWNCGVEGPTEDPAVLALRDRQKRALIASTLLALGVPMLLAGDEFGRTQKGNNNAYCQDNEVSWVDWAGRSAADLAFEGLVQRLLQFRAEHAAVRWPTYPPDGHSRWFGADGRWMPSPDAAQDGPLGLWRRRPPAGEGAESIMILFNPLASAVEFRLPRDIDPAVWSAEIASGQSGPAGPVRGAATIGPHSLVVLCPAAAQG